MATHHIDTITSLLEQLDTIRYQEPVATSYPLGESSRLNSVHSLFRAFADNLKLAETQDALRAARTSEISDAKEIIWDDEDERVLIGKRRRLDDQAPRKLSPSKKNDPQLYVLPPGPGQEVSLDGLANYIRSFNQIYAGCSLRVWSKLVADGRLANPVILLAKVRDKCSIYITTENAASPSEGLVVRSLTVFGPREKKAPHAASEYNMFNEINLFFRRILAENSPVSIARIMDLITTYTTLFSDTCLVCGKMVSKDDLPPLIRVWVESNDADGPSGNISRWASRHLYCRET